MESDQTENKSTANQNAAGCLGAFFIFFIAAVIFINLSSGSSWYEPSETNLCIEAIERSFDEVYRIVPDSLVLIDDFDATSHFSSCKSFENIAYVVNPILKAHLKANPNKKYNFQYLARLDHIGNEQFELKDFLVDEVWRDISEGSILDHLD